MFQSLSSLRFFSLPLSHLLAVWCLLVFSGCSLFRADHKTPRILPYMVQPGDSPERVAERYGLSVRELLERNGLQRSSKLNPGQQIYLPAARLVSPLRVRRDEHLVDAMREAEQHVGFLTWPLPEMRRINSRFGPRWSRVHEGIDLGGREGANIIAAHDGAVIFSGNRHDGYGNVVLLQAHRLITAYAHNQRNLVKAGDIVFQGQRIAELGKTGRVTGPHLHFETRILGQAGAMVKVNPVFFFPDR